MEDLCEGFWRSYWCEVPTGIRELFEGMRRFFGTSRLGAVVVQHLGILHQGSPNLEMLLTERRISTSVRLPFVCLAVLMMMAMQASEAFIVSLKSIEDRTLGV